jgi:hypothetical protein
VGGSQHYHNVINTEHDDFHHTFIDLNRLLDVD